MTFQKTIEPILNKISESKEHQQFQSDPVQYLRNENLDVKGFDELNDEQQLAVTTALKEMPLTGIFGCKECKWEIGITCGTIIVGTIAAAIFSDGLAEALASEEVEGAVGIVASESGLSFKVVNEIIIEAWGKTSGLQFLGVFIAMICEKNDSC